ncbi:DNA repair protein RecN [bacterium]|nr:DNA repair protein RecN [bacterium]
MLSELVIKNFALVEDVTFTFTEGLNILTGETGAGKSLIIEAMGFLLGANLKEKPLRTGAASGFVAAHFTDLPEEVELYLHDLGCELSDNELILSRDFKAVGKTCCRLNERPVTLSTLRELGTMLVDLHGQHQQYSLLRSSDHLKVLDRYVISKNENFLKLQSEYIRIFKQISSLRRELEDLQQNERSRLREIDWTRHELEEIEGVDPILGEDESLQNEIRTLSAASQLRNGAYEAHAQLNGEGGARDRLSQVCDDIAHLVPLDNRLEGIEKGLNEALAIIDDSIYELSNYADTISADEDLLEEKHNRLESLRRLMRKYGPGIAEVLEYKDNLISKLAQLENSTYRVSHLEEDIAKLKISEEELLERISVERQAKALLLAKAVEEELAQLGMAQCRFEVMIKRKEISISGWDNVEFVISPNPGEEAKPLIAIASGGEISRIMLAMLTLFSEFQKTSTFFFDEIDAGLGGRAAQAVANRLRKLADNAQVICVTHQAILAVAGQCHHHLYKEVNQGRTSTHVVILEGEEREEEIARMLSGDTSSKEALEHARSLLQGAGR